MRSSLFCAYFSRFSSEVCYYNLSPQGDGNADFLPNSLNIMDYNLSPQGDGNISSLGLYEDLENYNLSPQGDGNLIRTNLDLDIIITTYPRKGTETRTMQS